MRKQWRGAAQMKLRLGADEFRKVRDVEPEVDCVWSWGVEGRTGFFIHTILTSTYLWSFESGGARSSFLWGGEHS